MFAETEDKRPNIITKDTPIASMAQEIAKVLEAVSWKLRMKTKHI